jgi:hypothetical protein
MEDYIKDYIFLLDKIRAHIYKRSHDVLQSLLHTVPGYSDNVIDIFIRTNLIEKDPYGYEQADQFCLPREAAFVGGNPALEKFQRLACLKHSYWLLSNQLEQSPGVPPLFIENCYALLENVNFSELNFSNTNTRFIKELYDTVMETQTSEVKEVLEHNFKLLAENYSSLRSQIETLSRFNRDYYKMSFRFKVFPTLDKNKFTVKMFKENKNAYMTGLKQIMQSNPGLLSWQEIYIAEAVQDCYGKTSEQALDLLKSRYLSDADIKKLPRTQRLSLVSLLKQAASAKTIIYNLIYVLDQSYQMYNWHETGILSRIILLLKKLFKLRITEKTITIQFYDPLLGKIISENTYFSKFKTEVAKTHQKLVELEKKDSVLFADLARGTPDEMFSYFKKIYFDIYNTKEKSIGFNNCFLTLLKNSYIYLKQNEKLIKQLDTIVKQLHAKHKEYSVLYKGSRPGKK